MMANRRPAMPPIVERSTLRQQLLRQASAARAQRKARPPSRADARRPGSAGGS